MVEAFQFSFIEELDKHFKFDRATVLLTNVKWPCGACLFHSKTNDRHNCLSEHHLDNIIRIMIEGSPLSQWDPSRAIQLWWQEKQRRSVGDTRKSTKEKR